MNESAPAAEEALLAAGLTGLCCVLVSLVGIVGLIVWLVRSRNAPSTPAATGPAPAQPVAPGPGAPFHLSVLALSFDAFFRAQVQAALVEATGAADSVAHRVALVQRLAHTLAGLEAQWQHFGYGEKDLLDLASAQQSYAAALADFRGRAALAASGGALCVVTLVLCTRGQRTGVDRLDTRAQVRELLADRLRVDVGSLLGAEVVWAPAGGGLGHDELLARYPEMHLVTQ